MLVSVFISFGHFASFFALTAAIVLQLALLSNSLSLETALRIQRADRAAGMAAALILVFGFLRVFVFDKGAEYYFSNTFFLLKLGIFVAVALLSVYPTLTYLKWNESLNQGVVPELSTLVIPRLRKIIHYQLIGILAILLCASLIAKGYGV